MRFVHTDIYFTRRKRFRQRRKHFIDEFVSSIGIDKQYVVYVDDIGKLRQFHEICKMRKRLNSRNKFYSAFFRIRVDFADFFYRIPASHIAEIRFSFDFVGIFEIEFERVISRFR